MNKDTHRFDPEDLWIGDSIRHLETGIVGTFEGLQDGKVILHHNGGKIIGESLDFTLVDEQDAFEVEEEKHIAQGDLEEGSALDLHLAVLDQSREGDNPILIRNFQLRKCKEFMTKAIEQRLRSVVIIHGKGSGVLESDVLSYLDGVDEVVGVEHVHQGGAKRIMLRY